MRQINGNLWNYWQRRGHVICITTNGFVKRNGEAVMGRGCAAEATHRIPGVARMLGDFIGEYGNIAGWLKSSEDARLRVHPAPADLVIFPVKHKWWEPADLDLIRASTKWLSSVAGEYAHLLFILPRPGCGNGQLSWNQVLPIVSELPDNVHVIDFARCT